MARKENASYEGNKNRTAKLTAEDVGALSIKQASDVALSGSYYDLKYRPVVTLKHTLVGQSGNAADQLAKPWFKVASCRIDDTYEDKHIVFFSRETYGRDFNGTLVCRVRTVADFIIEIAQLYWLGDAFGVDFNNFVLAYKRNSDSVDFEIWCKIQSKWTGYQFDVVSEGSSSNTNEHWTLAPAGLTAGGLAAIPSDYTQIASRPAFDTPQSGLQHISVQPNGRTDVEIRFLYSFGHVPHILLSVNDTTGADSNLRLLAYNKTVNGFTIGVDNSHNQSFEVDVAWLAI